MLCSHLNELLFSGNFCIFIYKGQKLYNIQWPLRSKMKRSPFLSEHFERQENEREYPQVFGQHLNDFFSFQSFISSALGYVMYNMVVHSITSHFSRILRNREGFRSFIFEAFFMFLCVSMTTIEDDDLKWRTKTEKVRLNCSQFKEMVIKIYAS